MKYFIFLILIVSCGSSDDSYEEARFPSEGAETITDVEPVETIVMCQQAAACDSDGICVDTTKPVEFAKDENILYWQACYNFMPCDETESTGYTNEGIQNYIDGGHCGTP